MGVGKGVGLGKGVWVGAAVGAGGGLVGKGVGEEVISGVAAGETAVFPAGLSILLLLRPQAASNNKSGIASHTPHIALRCLLRIIVFVNMKGRLTLNCKVRKRATHNSFTLTVPARPTALIHRFFTVFVLKS